MLGGVYLNNKPRKLAYQQTEAKSKLHQFGCGAPASFPVWRSHIPQQSEERKDSEGGRAKRGLPAQRQAQPCQIR